MSNVTIRVFIHDTTQRLKFRPRQDPVMPEEPDRVTVSTYVPAAQREAWREDAGTMDMSLSEFVRSMVQSGRRGFSLSGTAEEGDVSGSDPGGSDWKSGVLERLRDDGPLGWDELLQGLAGDLEDELEAAIDELQDENRIKHSPRRGGYELVGEPDGD